jgi:hypothetical protein
VRRVDAVGTITTVAGNGDFFDSGDGLSATEAGLSSPFGLFVDAEGNLLVSSWEWSRIRRIEAGTGIISTVVDFSTTKDLFGDAAGRLFVGDAGNNVVRALETDGANTITVGSGAWGFGGDGGPAPFARLNAPVGVFVDARGSLFIADHHNHRIRRVDGLAAPTPPRAGVFQAAAMTAVPLETASTPEQTRLLDGYPNPFNAGTTLRYRLASATDVRLQLYDVAGRHVRTLVRRYRPAGNHQVAGTAPTTTAVPWPAVSTWRACRRWARSTWASCFCSSECPSVSPWGPVGSVAVARASKGHSRTSRSSPSRRDLGRRVVPA